MKNIFLKLFILLLSANTYSQIVAVEDRTVPYAQNGYYYKDINHVLDEYEGTYEYSNNGYIMRIQLVKKIHSSNNDIFYEDMIIGGMQIIKDGVTKLSTIPNIDVNSPNGESNKLYTNLVYPNDWRGCVSCYNGGVNLLGTVIDMNARTLNKIRIKKVTYNGNEALKILIQNDMTNSRWGTKPYPETNYIVGEELILLKL